MSPLGQALSDGHPEQLLWSLSSVLATKLVRALLLSQQHEEEMESRLSLVLECCPGYWFPQLLSPLEN